jgi:phosphatidylinositol alpha 1,6-mannosyltransferase
MIHRIIAVLEDIVVGLSSQQMRHGPEHSSGRLAAEKVRRLAELSDLGYRVVVVGDGPDRAALESSLPSATFLEMRSGADLATERGPGWLSSCAPARTRPSARPSRKAPGLGRRRGRSGRGCGPLDLIRPGETGLRFEPGQTCSLRKAVSFLLDNPMPVPRSMASGTRPLILAWSRDNHLCFMARVRTVIAGRSAAP